MRTVSETRAPPPLLAAALLLLGAMGGRSTGRQWPVHQSLSWRPAPSPPVPPISPEKPAVPPPSTTARATRDCTGIRWGCF